MIFDIAQRTTSSLLFGADQTSSHSWACHCSCVVSQRQDDLIYWGGNCRVIMTACWWGLMLAGLWMERPLLTDCLQAVSRSETHTVPSRWFGDVQLPVASPLKYRTRHHKDSGTFTKSLWGLEHRSTVARRYQSTHTAGKCLPSRF